MTARFGGRRRWSRWLIAAALALGCALVAVFVDLRIERPVRARTTAFNVVGTAIETGTGKTFVPLGMTIFGLAAPNWATLEPQDMAQIDAAAGYWHANTVRIQVSPLLLIAGTPGYVSAIQSEVNAAERLGLVVILSAQYERTGNSRSGITAPNLSTLIFWRRIARRYASDQRVWFDLFNEPRTDKPYSVWKHGAPGIVGMQELVDDIRAIAPDNVIIAESINDVAHFEGIGSNVLNGSNIVYAVHPYFYNPNDPVRSHSTSWWRAQWQGTWGRFAERYPVIIGEWGEFEANSGECQLNARVVVAAFLRYISSLHLGLIAWALTPGVLIDGTDLEKASTFDKARPFNCTGVPTAKGQGAGQDVRQYFLHHGMYRG